MKLKRIVRLSAAAATAALLATSLGMAPASANTRDTVRYAGSNTPTSLNPAHRQHNLLENGNINYLTSDGFNYYDNKTNLVKKTRFGTYRVISRSPLRVQYTIAAGLTWSDGAPIDAYDVLLPWVTSSGLFDNADRGVLWDAVGKRGGTEKATKFPTISNGGRTITFTYDEFVANWEVLVGIGKPVHALTQLAYPGDSNQAAKVRFFKAVRAKDWTTLKRIADQWNTAYHILNTTGVTENTNPKLLVASGAYMVKSAVPGRSVTMVLNPRYKSGPIPKIKTIQSIVVSDATAAAQALINGDLDLISPQATKEAVESLKANNRVRVISYGAAIYEHLDIDMNAPAFSGMSAAKALDIRRAILLTIPRSEIVDKLVKPVANSARVLNSMTPYFTNTTQHAQMAAANGVRPYTANETTRLAEARALLAKHGITPSSPLELKLLHGTPNERRENQAALIAAAGAKVGLKITPVPLVAWGPELGLGKYELQLFAWVQTSSYFTSLRNIYGWDPVTDTKRTQNYFGWKNLAVERTLTRHFTDDLTATQKFSVNLAFEKEYFKDAIGLPLFQHPGVAAAAAGLKNIKPSPFSPINLWNYWEWSW